MNLVGYSVSPAKTSLPRFLESTFNPRAVAWIVPFKAVAPAASSPQCEQPYTAYAAVHYQNRPRSCDHYGASRTQPLAPEQCMTWGFRPGVHGISVLTAGLKVKNRTIKISVNNKFIRNVLSLSFLQGANLLLPLIILPFLARTLGVDGYGLFVFAGVVVGYFGLIIDYGFNLTGTRDIALVRNNPDLLNLLVSKIFLIKICLLLLCAVSFLLISFFIQEISDNFLLYVCSFGVVIGQTFFPTWFFQGVEDFKSVVVLNFISKLIFTVLIFFVVSEPSDAYLAALMNSLGGFFSTFLAVRIVFVKHKVRVVKVRWNEAVSYAKKSIFVFMAQLKISLFSTANVFILGVLCGPKSVGYFSAAEKIMRALAQLQVPLLTVLYPKLSVDLIEKRNQSISLLSKLTKYGTLFYCIAAFFVVAFADYLIALLFGPEYLESVSVLRIVAICPLLIFLNNIYGTQVLLNFGKDRLYLMVLVVAGAFNVGASILLTINYGAAGTAFSLLCSELIVVIGMFYFAKNYLVIVLDETSALKNKGEA